MEKLENSKIGLTDAIIKIAEAHAVSRDRLNLEKLNEFLKEEKTPSGNKYMNSKVVLNYDNNNDLEKITLERPYQLRDVHNMLMTFTETYRVYSRKK